MTEHAQLEIVAAVVLLGGQIIAAWKSNQAAMRSDQAAEIAGAAYKASNLNGQKLDQVHGLVNSEMANAREMMTKAIQDAAELAYARGYEKGGENARKVSADALVAAAKALPPVIVPPGEPDPDQVGIRRS